VEEITIAWGASGVTPAAGSATAVKGRLGEARQLSASGGLTLRSPRQTQT